MKRMKNNCFFSSLDRSWSGKFGEAVSGLNPDERRNQSCRQHRLKVDQIFQHCQHWTGLYKNYSVPGCLNPALEMSLTLTVLNLYVQGKIDDSACAVVNQV